MSGLNLREMEASEMLDVIHFLLEEDWAPESTDKAEMRSEIRVAVYRDMYGKTYAYPLPKRDKSGNRKDKTYTDHAAMDNTYMSSASDLDDLAAEKPFDPRTAPPKPFTPASTFNPDAAKPFKGLDAPLG